MEEHNYNNKGNKGKNNGWDSDRAHRIAASVLAIIMIAGLTVYGVYWNIKAKKGAESNDIAYRRAFSDLLGHLDDTENYLLKAMASSTPERTSLMLEEAWRSSALAENSLSVLPINQGVLSDVSKYLVQVGDAAKSWNAKTVGGESIAEEDSETLTRLYGYAQDLNGAFEYMAYCVGSGCTWKDIEKYSSAVVDNADIAKEYAFLENFSVPFADYPSLIYDGPFSEHMKTREAGALPENEITAEKGIEVLRKIFDKEDLQSIRLAYENKSGSVETFCYEIKLERENGAAASDNVKNPINLRIIIRRMRM